MRPGAADLVSAEDLKAFEEVRHCLVSIHEVPLKGIELTSHVIAAAVEEIFGLRCQHGAFYSKKHKHSWVVTKDGNVIDVYPLGSIGLANPPAITPYLMCVTNGSPRLYKLIADERFKRHYQEMQETELFRHAVSVVSQHLRRQLHALYMKRLNGHKRNGEEDEPREE